MAINTDELVEAATSKETFDVFAFVEGTNTPSDKVTVYTDADAALRLARIFVAEAEREELQKAEGIGLADETGPVADEDEITELHERLVASGLTFHLKGLAPKAREAIEKNLKATTNYREGAENEEYIDALNNTIIAKSIISVENAAGAIDERKWTPEQVGIFNETLYASEANKLFGLAAEINYVGAIFDRAVNADFS
jgi:hypothetical protein